MVKKDRIVHLTIKTNDTNPSEHTQIYPVPLHLDPNKFYEIALYMADIWMTRPNITGTETLRISTDNGANFPFYVDFSEGTYDISEINARISENIIYTTHPFSFQPIYSNGKVRFTADDGSIQIDFVDAPQLAKLLGFGTAGPLPVGSYSSLTPELGMEGKWKITCDLVERCTMDGGDVSDSLYDFTPLALPYSKLTIEPKNFKWIPMKTIHQLHNIHINLKDENNKIIPMKRPHTYHIMIRAFDE